MIATVSVELLLKWFKTLKDKERDKDEDERD